MRDLAASRSLLTSLRTLWPYIKRQQLLIIGASLALLAEIALRLMEPWPIKWVVDALIHSRPFPGAVAQLFGSSFTAAVVGAAIATVLITGLRALSAYASTVWFALASNRAVLELRRDLFAHLIRLPLRFHTNERSGELVTRAVSDTGRVQDLATGALVPLVVDVSAVIGAFAVMFWMQWSLALSALVVLPSFLWLALRTSAAVHQAARRQRRREGATAAIATEAMAAVRVVQSLSLETAFTQRFDTQSQRGVREGVLGTRLQARLERGVDAFAAVATAIVLAGGALLVRRGSLTAGDLVILLAYLKNGVKPMRDLAKYAGRLAKGAAAAERVLALLATDSVLRDRPNATDVTAAEGRLTLSGVSYAYEPGRDTLTAIDLDIAPGERVAIVGPSGSGKSTLAAVILRLMDPVAGTVRLDGRDARRFTLTSYRAQFAVVPQETVLFTGTVAENIQLGLPNAALEDVRRAARTCCADEFVAALPDGYDTVVSERGSSLSGGERQRLALARAALRSAPILVLDEPTVALDARNERLVREALERVSRGRTCVTITHDLHLAASADRIAVLEAGRLTALGTHDQLMAADGWYAQTYAQQAAQRPLPLEPANFNALIA